MSSSTLLKYVLSSICLSPFHFFQFFSNLFKYSSSNFWSSHPYNIFAVNFPGNFPLLKSLSSAMSIFSCLLTSTLIFPSNSFMASSAFFKFSILSQVSPSAVNPFHRTRYFSTPLIFFYSEFFLLPILRLLLLLLGFPSSFFCPSTCSLYHTIRLTFTTR